MRQYNTLWDTRMHCGAKTLRHQTLRPWNIKTLRHDIHHETPDIATMKYQNIETWHAPWDTRHCDHDIETFMTLRHMTPWDTKHWDILGHHETQALWKTMIHCETSCTTGDIRHYEIPYRLKSRHQVQETWVTQEKAKKHSTLHNIQVMTSGDTPWDIINHDI